MKSKYLYRVALVLSIYLFALSFIAAIDFIRHSNYLISTPYSDSSSFKTQLSNYFKTEISNYFRNIKEFHVDYKNYSQKSEDDKINKEEMDSIETGYEHQLAAKNQEIEYSYTRYIDEAEKAGDKNKASSLFEEKNRKLDEAKAEYINTIDRIKKDNIAKRDSMYDYLKKYISSRSYIKYYIKDSISKETYTNLENIPDINNYIQSNSLYSIKFPQESNTDTSLSSLSNEFKNSGFEGYFIIPEKIESYNQIDDSYKYFNSIKSVIIRYTLNKEAIIVVVSMAIGISLLLYLRKKKEVEIDLFKKLKISWRKIPLDVQILIFIIYTSLMIFYIMNVPFFYAPFNINHIFNLTLMAIYITFLMISLTDVLKVIKDKVDLKNHLENSLLLKLVSLVKNNFVNKNNMFKISLLTILTILFPFCLLCAILTFNNVYAHVYFITSILYVFIYLATVPYYALKRITFLNKIIKGTEEIASGNFNYVLAESGSGNLSRLAHNINNMKIGFKKSLETQIKSERLKSELITNVSHDLKTPLTSIVNYVNLLKRDDLSKEEIQDYVGVLDRKTQRLKVLIEDLFEASKMASGSVELNIERIDVASLLNQSLAEVDDKIKNSSLIFKINTPKQKVYANLDGKKTWRVFENLINNALKYSQSNTRVYIDLLEYDSKIVFTIKNISAYEMNFDVEEIFERFKRGDTSRNTEGSGLGLAIAKSIVELQGGTLKIEIDGDLFKAIVEFHK